MVQYHNALLCWKEERERQQDEFTITEKSLTEIQGILTEKVLFHKLSYFQYFVVVFFTIFTVGILQEFVAPPVRKGPPLRKYKVVLICGQYKICPVYEY